MEMSVILDVVVILSWVYTYVKTDRIVQFKYLQFNWTSKKFLKTSMWSPREWA